MAEAILQRNNLYSKPSAVIYYFFYVLSAVRKTVAERSVFFKRESGLVFYQKGVYALFRQILRKFLDCRYRHYLCAAIYIKRLYGKV